MRWKSFAGTTIAVLLPVIAMPQAASAFGWKRSHGHHSDPYEYRFESRGYYPYYNSDYWRPAHKVRRRRGLDTPKYYPAWGAKKRHYQHGEWHAQNHRRHRFWQW